MAAAAERIRPDAHFRLTTAGIAARAAVMGSIVLVLLLLPLYFGSVQDQWMGLAAIYAVIGLSVNVITGHAGQISLGHQAFVGIGAFASAYLVNKSGLSFYLALPLAGLTGGIMAAMLGAVALRIRGLYLALVTLAFGQMTNEAIFQIRGFTGGGAGIEVARPAMFETDQAYAYMCMLVLALFIFVDWRLVKSKAGRAIVSIRNDERVAASLGINVTGYKLLAFVLGGFIAGIAGSLFAHWNQFVQTEDFNFFVALVWILMAVVGGLGSRAGVVIGSAFFAVFPLVLASMFGGSSFSLPFLGDVLIQNLSPFIGALLLLLTITRFPGGIGQQLLPLRTWIAGGPFHVPRHRTRTVSTGAAPSPEVAGEPVPAAMAVTEGMEIAEPLGDSEAPVHEDLDPAEALERAMQPVGGGADGREDAEDAGDAGPRDTGGDIFPEARGKRRRAAPKPAPKRAPKAATPAKARAKPAAARRAPAAKRPKRKER